MDNMHGKLFKLHGNFCKSTKVNFEFHFFLKNKLLQNLTTETCKVLYVAYKKCIDFLQSATKNFLQTSMLLLFCSACKIFDAFSKNCMQHQKSSKICMQLWLRRLTKKSNTVKVAQVILPVTELKTICEFCLISPEII